MINELSISHFKQLKNIHLSKIAPITVIGGRNNTGKTSLLEALFMFYDRGNPELIIRQFNWRGINHLDLSPSGIWAPIFYAYDMSKSITINVKQTDNTNEKLEIRHNEKYNKVIRTTPYVVTLPQTHITTKQHPTESLDFLYSQNGQPTGQVHCVIEGPQIGLHIEELRKSKTNVVYVSSGTQSNPNEDAVRFGKIDIAGGVDELVDGLKVIEPRLKSLSTISLGNQSLIYGDIGMGRKVPISFMGEGTAKLLSIILSIATCKNGMVLIDELENGIHYTVHAKLWDLLARLSKKYNCQIIATTHSYEILKSLKNDIADKQEQKLFAYYRLDCSNDEISAKHFDMNSLFAAIERDWEIR